MVSPGRSAASVFDWYALHQQLWSGQLLPTWFFVQLNADRVFLPSTERMGSEKVDPQSQIFRDDGVDICIVKITVQLQTIPKSAFEGCADFFGYSLTSWVVSRHDDFQSL